jgi:hypothetical protein
MVFECKKNNTKYVFWFSLQLLSKTFLILRKDERDVITNKCVYVYKVRVILVRHKPLAYEINPLTPNDL